MVSSKPPEPLQQFLYPSRKSAHALERLGWPLCTTNPQQIEATDHGRRLLVERMNIYYSSTQTQYSENSKEQNCVDWTETLKKHLQLP